MFEHIELAPPDPVFGLAEAFRSDPRPEKINLTVGAYQTDAGVTPVLNCVKTAEQHIIASQQTKNYLPIDGSRRFAELVAELVLGGTHPAFVEGRYATAHTPGGTAALRIAGDFLRHNRVTTTIWMCDPTWANHPQIYQAAGMTVKKYPYLTEDRRGLDFESLLRTLRNSAQPQDALLLHTVCHNPTGFDFDREQWEQILDLCCERDLIPVFDFAYQGFGRDIDTDAWPIREYLGRGREALVCSSFSKNLGLYSERVGALTVVARPGSKPTAILSQIKSIIRTLYSTPPQHGGEITQTILGSAELRAQWLVELQEMRERIQQLRSDFGARLQPLVPQQDFEFIRRQVGMFSFSGLTREQVIRLREEFAIYAVESGRINVAGINSSNSERLCQSIAAVCGNAVAASR